MHRIIRADSLLSSRCPRILASFPTRSAPLQPADEISGDIPVFPVHLFHTLQCAFIAWVEQQHSAKIRLGKFGPAHSHVHLGQAPVRINVIGLDSKSAMIKLLSPRPSFLFAIDIRRDTTLLQASSALTDRPIGTPQLRHGYRFSADLSLLIQRALSEAINDTG